MLIITFDCCISESFSPHLILKFTLQKVISSYGCIVCPSVVFNLKALRQPVALF